MVNKGEKKSRVVCDYIAGMSDIYAIDQFEELFVPKRWNVYYDNRLVFGQPALKDTEGRLLHVLSR